MNPFIYETVENWCEKYENKNNESNSLHIKKDQHSSQLDISLSLEYVIEHHLLIPSKWKQTTPEIRNEKKHQVGKKIYKIINKIVN